MESITTSNAKASGPVEPSAASKVSARHSLKTRITLVTLAIFLLSLWSLSYYTTRVLRGDMERLLSEQQYSTVSLLATQINRDLSERLAALVHLANGSAETMRKGPAAMQAFIEQHPALHGMFISGMFAVSVDGTVVADFPISTGRLGLNIMDRDYVFAALTEGKATIGRPVVGRVTLAPIIVMAAPIRDSRGEVIGALGGAISLNVPNFLDEITENRYGKTGGYMISAPQHRLIVTATDKRRVMEALPAFGVDPAIDRLIEGREGSAVLVGPDGIETLISAKGVPVSNWQVMVSLPTAEAFAPIESMQRQMFYGTLFLTLLAGSVCWWTLRRQLSPLVATAHTLASLPETSEPLQPLPVARPDEIGQLIGGFNRLLKTLGERKEALRESEERFRALHDAAFSGILIHDHGTVLDCNQGLLDLTGYTREDFIGADGFEKLIAPGWRAVARRNSQSGQELVYEVEGLRKDGRTYPLCVHSRNFTYKDRAVRVVEFSDITELKEAEAKLVESESRLQMLLQAIPSPVFYKDAEGFYTGGNKAFEQYVGLSREQFIGKTVYDVADRDLAEKYARADQELLNNPGVQTYEASVVDADGSCHDVIFYKATFTNSDGKVAGLIGVILDITERKRAEEALRDSHDVLRSILETTKDGFLRLDTRGHLIDVNPAYCQLSGYTREELLGLHISSLEAAESAAEVSERIQRLKDTTSEQFETMHRRKDGSVWYVEVSTTYRSNDAAGELFAFVRDISERKWAEEKVVESEARLQTLIQTLPDLIWLKDAEGVYLACNHRFERFFGASEKDIVGKTDYDFVDRELADFFRKRDQVAMAKGVPSANEEWITFADDGHRELLETTKTPMFDAHGHLIGVLGIGHDITERRRADEALRKLSLAVEQSPVSIVITDLEGRIEYVNPAFSLTSGYSAAEALGQNPRVLKSGNTPQETYTKLWATLVEGKTWRGEFVNRRKDGTEYLEAATISPVRQPDGTVTHYLAVKEDVTELMRTMGELRLSEERLRLAKNAAGLGIFDWDIVKGRGEWDARARELGGIGPDEPISAATLVAGIPPDDLAVIQASIDKAFDPLGSGEYHSEVRIHSRIDGRTRQVAANGQVFFEGDRPVRIVGTLKDVTRQRQLEEEIKERRKAMESLVNQQVAAQTAAAIAHELNQPLVAVAAYSEAALRILQGGTKSPERLARALKGAEEQAQRAGRTLHELLDFLHKGEAPTEAVELTGVVRDALAIVEESGSGKFRALVDIEPGLPAVLANRLQLQKVLVNLLHNGVEAMRGAGVADPTITIKAHAIPEGNMAQVTVQDTGPGLDAATAHRVFDSFFTTKPDGVGLGLAISRALIEAHGGKLWADSKTDGGAAFHFVLPFAA
ncbi:MAG: PAS domain S-box protein [Propionivibrio sp.]